VTAAQQGQRQTKWEDTMTVQSTPRTTLITDRRRITAAAAVIVSAGAIAAAGLGSAAPAIAAPDQYVVLSTGALGYIDQNGYEYAGGVGIGPDASADADLSMSNCKHNGSIDCHVMVTAKNACGAVASNRAGDQAIVTDPVLDNARQNALNALPNKDAARIVVSDCAGSQPAPPNPPSPAKQGPTVSWNPIVGGLEAHITDRSGVSSQCTYTTDNFNRSFALPANSTYDLKIVPAIPEHRNWNVTITCDNGTSTQATTYF
jgi:hypothetical protein